MELGRSHYGFYILSTADVQRSQCKLGDHRQVAMCTTMQKDKLAKFSINEIVRLHGVLASIVSD